MSISRLADIRCMETNRNETPLPTSDADKIKAAVPVMRDALQEAAAEGYIGVGLISVADAVGEHLGLTPTETDIVRGLAR